MSIWKKALKVNFEYRVIISYLIFGIALLTLIFSKDYNYNIIADFFGLNRTFVMMAVFLFIGVINLATWIFRSYAGGYLSGYIIVTKKVQTHKLITGGPYAYVRNPLYVADTIAMTSVGLAGGPVAITILFFGKVITSYMYAKYEERSLLEEHDKDYKKYMENVPRFIPRLTPYKKSKDKTVKIDWKEGLAYNFYAFGIGIAFIIAAITEQRRDLYIYGFITPILWFFIRFFDRHIKKIIKK